MEKKMTWEEDDDKAVAWHSDARSLERRRISRESTTTPRVVIILND